MNKIILISIFILFAICSRSWAGELDGKGLICGNNIYYFNWGDVNLMGLEYGKRAKIVKKQSVFYKTDSDYIYFSMWDSLDWEKTSIKMDYRVDRESLALIINVASQQPAECFDDPFVFLDDENAENTKLQCEIKKRKIIEESKKTPFKIINYCEVSNWKGIKKYFKPQIDNYNKKIKDKESKNKI